MAPLTAKDIMTDLLVTVQGDATLEAAAGLMLQMDIGSLLVVDFRGHLIGILTDADFAVSAASDSDGEPAGMQVLGHRVRETMQVEEIYRAARARRVRDVMSTAVVTVAEDDAIETLLARMFQNRIRHLPVVRDQLPVGIVSSRDLLQLIFVSRPNAESGRGPESGA
ncbi:MAG: CBS domain-containing protein [Gemmatimonadales bacterium]